MTCTSSQDDGVSGVIYLMFKFARYEARNFSWEANNVCPKHILIEVTKTTPF